MIKVSAGGNGEKRLDVRNIKGVEEKVVGKEESTPAFLS